MVACGGILHKNARFMETIEHIRDLPMLGNDAIHIWGVHVPDVLDRIDALRSVLCEKEQAKAARFYREGDRNSSIVARGALRILLGGYSGIPPERILFDYSENGKPFLAPSPVPKSKSQLEVGDTEEGHRDACDILAFNVSHSGEWVVLAIGQNRNIGVDVEKIRRGMDVMSIASRYFTPEEAVLIEKSEDQHALFFHHWARKEAYVKATGSALFRELSTFSVPNEDAEKDGWFFQRLEAGSNYATAIVSDKPVLSLPCYDFSKLNW
ncbi:MAG: 4'-phosphopantetheinyl transferase superfamily protein [Kiritimatiellaceae bacterium]|nr:4'-phosphopantetheinyl transferase superfamily protein [Kiritimatiellaceae bacterium]